YMFYDLFRNYIELKAETLTSSCLINDGKGNFTRMDLPNDVQQAPVFSFAQLPGTGHRANYLAGGNFYGARPYEGRYDALFPTQFSFDKDDPRFRQGDILPDVHGEVRDLKWLHTAKYGELLLAARNSDSLLFYKLTK
ncbi:MAG: hypothetical protein Q8932_14145, partial [Bacteroidota bacterium]|nr:hypothetical protein [Bacteroidota bacterium]